MAGLADTASYYGLESKGNKPMSILLARASAATASFSSVLLFRYILSARVLLSVAVRVCLVLVCNSGDKISRVIGLGARQSLRETEIQRHGNGKLAWTESDDKVQYGTVRVYFRAFATVLRKRSLGVQYAFLSDFPGSTVDVASVYDFEDTD